MNSPIYFESVYNESNAKVNTAFVTREFCVVRESSLGEVVIRFLFRGSQLIKQEIVKGIEKVKQGFYFGNVQFFRKVKNFAGAKIAQIKTLIEHQTQGIELVFPPINSSVGKMEFTPIRRAFKVNPKKFSRLYKVRRNLFGKCELVETRAICTKRKQEKRELNKKTP